MRKQRKRGALNGVGPLRGAFGEAVWPGRIVTLGRSCSRTGARALANACLAPASGLTDNEPSPTSICGGDQRLRYAAVLPLSTTMDCPVRKGALHAKNTSSRPPARDEGADECRLFGAKRTLTNRCLPIAIKVHGLVTKPRSSRIMGSQPPSCRSRPNEPHPGGSPTP